MPQWLKLKSRLLILAPLVGATSLVAAKILPAPAPRAASESTPLLPYREIFRRSISDLSGDIFLLPEPFNYLLDDVELAPKSHHASHLATHHDGKVDLVLPPHPISMHGFAWDYDLKIPLSFYDPTGQWFRPGQYPQLAVQQDIAPTLADVLGIAAPDRAEGRILREARATTKAPPPKVLAVVVGDQVGLQYLAAHPQRAPFLRQLLRDGAAFPQAQVAHVDVETAVGHAAIGTGAYPRGHHVSSNTFWHPGLWAARPVYSAALSESLTAEAFPLHFDAMTLADVWSRSRAGRPRILSMVAAARASVSLGGHGAMVPGAPKSAVMYFEAKGPDAGTYTTNPSFYQLPASMRGQNVRSTVAEFLAERGGPWFDHPLLRPDGSADYALIQASPAMVRFESGLLSHALRELAIGERDETDLVFVNFKSTDYCGHLFGYESEECGEVLTAADQAVAKLYEQLKQQSSGEILLTFTADHGAAPIPELSGGVRFSRQRLLADLNRHFDRLNNRVDAVGFMSSSQIWLNRQELALNGFTVADVVRFLKSYEVPFEAPYNTMAAQWRARGKPARARFFRDVVGRDELAAKGTSQAH